MKRSRTLLKFLTITLSFHLLSLSLFFKQEIYSKVSKAVPLKIKVTIGQMKFKKKRSTIYPVKKVLKRKPRVVKRKVASRNKEDIKKINPSEVVSSEKVTQKPDYSLKIDAQYPRLARVRKKQSINFSYS